VSFDSLSLNYSLNIYRETKYQTCHRTSLWSKPVFTSTEVYAKVFTLQDKVRKENGYIKKSQ